MEGYDDSPDRRPPNRCQTGWRIVPSDEATFLSLRWRHGRHAPATPFLRQTARRNGFRAGVQEIYLSGLGYGFWRLSVSGATARLNQGFWGGCYFTPARVRSGIVKQKGNDSSSRASPCITVCPSGHRPAVVVVEQSPTTAESTARSARELNGGSRSASISPRQIRYQNPCP